MQELTHPFTVGFHGYTKVIRKVGTVCAHLTCILETVPLRMCSDFLYHLLRHKRYFVKIVLCLCLFLCVNMFKTIEGADDCEIGLNSFLNATKFATN